MGEVKHTPGPWVAERICLDGNEWSVVSSCRLLPPFQWCPRLRVGLPPLFAPGGVTGRAGLGEMPSAGTELTAEAMTENKANAYLIAAAPDLLAALKEVVGDGDRKTDEFDRARAAIAKATGGAT